jgi:hypothetical protein
MISRASVACGRVRQTTTTSEAARASRPPPRRPLLPPTIQHGHGEGGEPGTEHAPLRRAC